MKTLEQRIAEIYSLANRQLSVNSREELFGETKVAVKAYQIIQELQEENKKLKQQLEKK